MVSKTPIPEIIGPEPDHEYNNPDLNDLEWLHAVRNERKLPMSVRIDAAKAAAVYAHPRLAQVNQDMTVGATIRIEGGLPQLPGTNIIMPQAPNQKTTNGSGEPTE
jgi:hypothetical protein